MAIREAHFTARPLCVRCESNGYVCLATELDHIAALVNGGCESRDPFVNRQGLCAECHALKTAEDLREAGVRR